MNLARRATWLLPLLPLAWCSCATLNVTTEHDPTVDFSRHKTFSFADPADIGEERTPDEAALQSRIEPAISRQLVTKGLRRIDTDQVADLAVYYWVNVTATKRKAWRRSYNWGASYGGAVQTYSDREGILVLDLVEPVKKKLVWRATIVAPLDHTTEENLDLATEAVARAFADYPPKQTAP
jgi:hypothetical protein